VQSATWIWWWIVHDDGRMVPVDTVPLLRLNSVYSSLVFFQVMYTFRVGYRGQQVDVLCVKGDYAVDMYDCYTVIDDHLMYVCLDDENKIRCMGSCHEYYVKSLYVKLIHIQSKCPFICQVKDTTVSIVHHWLQSDNISIKNSIKDFKQLLWKMESAQTNT
jgi:hypothetical protein